MIPISIPSAQLKVWLRSYQTCYDHRKPWRIVWMSSDERFIVVHQPGEGYSTNGGQHYGGACYDLIDTTGVSMGIPGRSALKQYRRWGYAAQHEVVKTVAELLAQEENGGLWYETR